MVARTVFMELPETINEMERQFVHLKALADSAEGNNKWRLRGKSSVLGGVLVYLRSCVDKGGDSDTAYKVIISDAFEVKEVVEASNSTNAERIALNRGIVEGYNLVLEKMRLARG